jgi:hypothetical protein
MALGVSGLLVILPTVSSACQPVTTSSSVSSAQVADAIAPGSDVLIVGDSYTSGRGSTSGVDGWAQDLVADRHWDATIDGYPGTGYVDTGRTGSSHYTFGPRLERHAEDVDPQLVIVQGSQNDWLVDSSTLQARVEKTLRDAEQTWPDAVVVALGPSAPLPWAKSTVGVAASVSAGAVVHRGEQPGLRGDRRRPPQRRRLPVPGGPGVGVLRRARGTRRRALRLTGRPGYKSSPAGSWQIPCTHQPAHSRLLACRR